MSADQNVDPYRVVFDTGVIVSVVVTNNVVNAAQLAADEAEIPISKITKIKKLNTSKEVVVVGAF